VKHRSLPKGAWLALILCLGTARVASAQEEELLRAQQELASNDIVECPGLDYDHETGLAGLVREQGAQFTIPGARVLATWTTGDGARNSRAAETDEFGVYVLCGVPVETSLEVRAMFTDFASDPVAVRIEAGPPAGWDFDIAVDDGVLRGDAAFPGRIVGRVLDGRSERPIEAADMSLVDDEVHRMTDGRGRFTFDALNPGIYRLRVDHLAYEPMEQVVSVPGNRTVEVNFELSADPIDVEPLVVTVVRDRRLEVRGYYDRRDFAEAVGNGFFIDQEDLRREPANRVSTLLNRVPGVRTECSGSGRNCRIVMTGGNPSLSGGRQGGCVNSNVYVDGVRVIRDNQDSPEPIDNFVSPGEIVGMEVYRGASEVPAEFGGSVGRCGAIVIWTGGG